VTLGSIIGIEKTNNSIKLLDQDPLTFYFIVAFLFSPIGSVVFSVWALWARIEIKPSLIPWTKIKPAGKPKRYDLPGIFFMEITDAYPVQGEKYSEEEDKKFFDEEIVKYKYAKEWLRALALEIIILSTNLKKKYFLINLSYLSLIASLRLMLLIIIFQTI
jgi:hypothetical protein